MAAAVAMLVPGCGAESRTALDFPDGIVAEVDGRPLTGAELGAFMTEVRASYDAAGRRFPEEGSPEYRNLTARAIEVLVERLQDDAAAAELGVAVTDAQVDAVLEQRRRAAGEAEFDRSLEEAAVSLDRLRIEIRAGLLRNEIFKAVVGGAEPTDEELRAYYDAHVDDYTRWPPREIDYLFVRDEGLARDLVARIEAGEDFSALVDQFAASGTRSGRQTFTEAFEDFQLLAFKLEEGDVGMVESGVGWSIVRPVSPRVEGRVLPFTEVADSLRFELTERNRATGMKGWEREADARLASLTTYAPGWDPKQLRSEVAFPVPPKQRSFEKCDLPDGEYTYEELLEKGCAGDFPLPGVDGPLCPERLIETPFTGGLFEEELESGYSDYLMDTAGTCVMDPRGQSLGLFRMPGRGIFSGDE